MRTKHARVQLGPRFAKLWGAGVAANVADGITAAALPLLAALLTRDPLMVAVVAALQTAPWFVFELFAGEIVDRVDRRRLMMWGNVSRAGAIGLVGVLVLTDSVQLWSLGAIAFAIGIAETLVDTSWEAIVPLIVADENLEAANGRTQAAEWTANQLLGPPLGGLVFALAAAAPFFINGAAFVAAAVLIALIPGVYATEREIEHGRGAMRRDIGQGIKWLWRNKILRALSITAATTNLFATGMLAVFVLFAQEILNLDNVGFGVVLAAGGVGGIIGSMLAHRVERRFGPATLMIASMGGKVFVALAVGLTSSPIVVGIAFAFDGFLLGLWNVVVVSLRQALTPNELRGRVTSDARTLAFGVIPIGALLGGFLANTYGLRAPFLLAAGAFVFVVIFLSSVVSNAKIADMRAEAVA